jgi:SNF2 family DNA or RNA helicase
MNYGNECYIIYDKFGGDSHSFNNPLTKKYDIKYLFENIKDGYITGKKAIEKYNDVFKHSALKITQDIIHNIDYNIINIHLFDFKNDDNCRIIILVISVMLDKMKEYYKLHKKIPSFDFVIASCKFHTEYTNSLSNNSTQDTNKIKKNIIKKVMIPNSEILEKTIDEPDFINTKTPLRDYQKKSVKWMYDIETEERKLHYGVNNLYELEIGELIYDPFSKKTMFKDEREFITFKGGALIDEIGNGKTIQMLTLSLLNRKIKPELVNTEKMMLNSRATLVICPSHLCPQWVREIKNMIVLDNLKIINILTKKDFEKYTYLDIIDADFVFLSYNFIGNSAFAGKYIGQISHLQTYHKSSHWSHEAVKLVFDKMRKELVSNPAKLFETEVLLTLINFHRIIVDEFHEVYTISKYSYVENIMPHFEGDYKWVVSGTPFNDNVENDCFSKMIDFVIKPQNIKIDLLQNREIREYIENNFFRRNQKDFVLPELSEKIVWLKFSQTERMMYNAYLANPNIDKFSSIVRQICCHPKIAEEIKDILGSSKSLADIEKSMVSHYKKEYEKAEQDVKKSKSSIENTENNIIFATYRRQKRFLKQMGYSVKVEYPEHVIKAQKIEELDSISSADDSDNNKEEVKTDQSTKIIVNEENQENIKNILKIKLQTNVSKTLNSLNELLKTQKEKLKENQKLCDGKKASYDFFNNMLDRIKKTTEKAQLKALKNKKEDEEEEEEEDENEKCAICLCGITGENVGVTNCGHLYCYECIIASVKALFKCPLCNKRQNEKDIMKISYEIPKMSIANTQIIKNKLDLINTVGTKLTNLIYYLNSIDDNVVLFSQWDSLLKKVGEVLDTHGIKNVFCNGNVFIRDKAIREFNENEKIKVIMLSSESSASGINLTKASKVVLLEPVSGDYEFRKNTEWQSIGRVYRLGQTKKVEIVRFIIKDTVEEEIYNMNKKADANIKNKLNISFVSDETITLTDERLKKLETAIVARNEEKTKIANKKKIIANKKI